MNNETIRELLVDGGLEKQAVDQILDEYSQMQSRFQAGEYAEIGVNVGKFSEGVVRILRLELTSELKSPEVREFAQACLNGDLAEDCSRAIQRHMPNMLHTAYDIRSHRDSAHMNLETSVNRADARLGIALCSSMLVELIREFVTEDDIEDIDEVSRAIDQLSTPVEENPLESLVSSRYDFERSRIAETLENIISIVDEEKDVQAGPEFFDLNVKQQVVALALGRLAAYDLNYIDQIGAKSSWYDDRSSYDKDRVEKQLKDREFIMTDFSLGGYFIPGYQSENAVEILSETS